MFLNRLFTDSPIDFKKRCRMRIFIYAGCFLAGALAFLLGISESSRFSEPSLASFYRGIGIGLMTGGSINFFMNVRYLKNEELGKKRALVETDERNRLLGLRCWAYAGYSMFLLLYLGILIGGFISQTVVTVLLLVMAVYAVLLLLFRMILSRMM